MKNKTILHTITKICICILLVYLLMSVSDNDIEYIYANF
jgi:hypothetical protein